MCRYVYAFSGIREEWFKECREWAFYSWIICVGGSNMVKGAEITLKRRVT